MSNRIRTLVFVVFAGFLGLLASGIFKPETPIDANLDFGTRLANRIELPTDSSSIRTVEYYADGKTRKAGVEDLADGTTNHYWYRANGTLDRAVAHAKADDNGYRSILRQTQMEPDGVTFRFDREFYPDGKVAKSVVLEDKNTTSRRYYHANGTLAKDQVLRRSEKVKWHLFFESARRADGSKEREYKLVGTPDAVYSFTDYHYTPAGAVDVAKVADYMRGTYIEQHFNDVGVLVKLIEQGQSGTSMKINRNDGSLAETYYWYGPVVNGYFMRTLFDTAGKKTATETWWFVGGQQLRRSAEWYDSAGNLKRQRVYRYGQDAGTLESENIFEGNGWNSGNRTQRTFRPDGSLEKEVVSDGKGEKLSEQTFAPGTTGGAHAEHEVPVFPLKELPPQVIAYFEDEHE